MKFQSVVRLNGKTATGIPVAEDEVESLGAGKRPLLRVTVNGYTYSTTLATVDGQYMLSVSGEVRESAHVAAGDHVEVDVEVDTRPRDVSLPPDFAEALDEYPDARRFFDGLSYSNKQRLVLPVEQAKSDETRQRRIEKAVSSLREGRV